MFLLKRRAIGALTISGNHWAKNIVKIVTKRTGSEIRDIKWQSIFDPVMEETDKEFNEYKGFGYSFHPMPLQIVIKTSLSKSSKDRAEKIEQYVKQVIEIKREKLSVEKVPYKVIIKGKNNKQVN